MLKKIPEFVQLIPDPAAFAKQFRVEQQRLLKVMEAYSQLLDDFQFILDTNGNLYHIDLDRNGRGDKETIHDKKELKEYLEWVDDSMNWLLQQLTPSLLTDDEPRIKCHNTFCKPKKAETKKQIKRKETRRQMEAERHAKRLKRSDPEQSDKEQRRLKGEELKRQKKAERQARKTLMARTARQGQLR